MTQPASPPPAGVTKSAHNTLAAIAHFIESRQATAIDRHIAISLEEISTDHDEWAATCAVGHMHDDIPCDDYARGISLGLAWLMSRIEERDA